MATLDEGFKDRIIRSADIYQSVDVRMLLNDKGIQYIDKGKYLTMRCLFPDHDDRKPSFSINTENYGYNCWGCNRTGTLRALAEELGWKLSEDGTVLTGIVQPYAWSDFKRNRNVQDSLQASVHLPIPAGFRHISGTDSLCSSHWEYARKRRIDHLIKEFRIGYTTVMDTRRGRDGRALYGSKYLNRLMIPIHDVRGKVLWIEGRSILPEVDAKYWRPFGVQRNEYLFNIHRVIRKRFRWVIVTEGVLTAAILWSWGFPAVAVFGSFISDNQMAALVHFDHIYVCLDNDPAGVKGYVEFKNRIRSSGVQISHIVMPPKQDALDTGRKVFEKKFSMAREIY